MPYSSGTADVGEDVTPICAVPATGARVKNLGGTIVYVGGDDVAAEGDGQGYPLDPGGPPELLQGAVAKETPVVPAPAGDMDDAVLYGRTAAGSGISRVAWITVSMT